MNGRPWTDAERARLLALKEAGMKNVAIAAELGRSATSVGAQLYALRHPDRAEAIQRAYAERQGERRRERGKARYREDRPRQVAAHRDYYAANREKVLARQAERRREDPARLRQLRNAANARNRASRNAGQNARNAVAKARAGDGGHLAKLTGLGPADALFWLDRLPANCVARAIVAKLREIAALQEQQRPSIRSLNDGRTRTGRPRGNFGVIVPLRGDYG